MPYPFENVLNQFKQKSIEQKLVELVKESGTYLQVKDALPALRVQGMTAAQEDAMWVSWGHKQQKSRLLTTFLNILVNAIYGETIKWGTIHRHSVIGGSNNTVRHIVTHVSQLCLESGWPPYGVLITDKDGNIPSGFFTWYAKHNGISEADALARKADLVRQCHYTNPPEIEEVILKFMLYARKHNL